MKKVDKLRYGVTTAVVGGIGFTFAFTGYRIHRDAKNQSRFKKEVYSLCSKVMKKFDRNGNEVMELDEIKELARATGYQGDFPTNYPAIRLLPECLGFKKVLLQISGPGDFYRTHSFPKSRLVEMVRRPQQR